VGPHTHTSHRINPPRCRPESWLVFVVAGKTTNGPFTLLSTTKTKQIPPIPRENKCGIRDSSSRPRAAPRPLARSLAERTTPPAAPEEPQISRLLGALSGPQLSGNRSNKQSWYGNSLVRLHVPMRYAVMTDRRNSDTRPHGRLTTRGKKTGYKHQQTHKRFISRIYIAVKDDLTYKSSIKITVHINSSLLSFSRLSFLSISPVPPLKSFKNPPRVGLNSLKPIK